MCELWKSKKDGLTKEITSSSTIKTIAELSFSREEDSLRSQSHSEMLIEKIIKLEHELYLSSIENEQLKQKQGKLQSILREKKENVASLFGFLNKQQQEDQYNEITGTDKDSIYSRDSLLTEQRNFKHQRHHSGNFKLRMQDEQRSSRQYEKFYSNLNSPEKDRPKRTTQLSEIEYKEKKYDPRLTNLDGQRLAGSIKTNNSGVRYFNTESDSSKHAYSEKEPSAMKKKKPTYSHTIQDIWNDSETDLKSLHRRKQNSFIPKVSASKLPTNSYLKSYLK